jgi:hypothetical protein
MISCASAAGDEAWLVVKESRTKSASLSNYQPDQRRRTPVNKAVHIRCGTCQQRFVYTVHVVHTSSCGNTMVQDNAIDGRQAGPDVLSVCFNANNSVPNRDKLKQSSLARLTVVATTSWYVTEIVSGESSGTSIRSKSRPEVPLLFRIGYSGPCLRLFWKPRHFIRRSGVLWSKITHS